MEVVKGGVEEERRGRRHRHNPSHRILPPTSRSTNSTGGANATSFSTIDGVVSYLRNLATYTPDRSWRAFGMGDVAGAGTGTGRNNDDEDPFMLKYLEEGTCPWGNDDDAAGKWDSTSRDPPPWLPPIPRDSGALSATYRDVNRRTTMREDGGYSETDAAEGRDVDPTEEADVAIWYEHVSKAGGTTFCALAHANMEVRRVPEYHCMPSLSSSSGKPSSAATGRTNSYSPYVGTWTNDVLLRYLTDTKHLVVSSEWDPFRSSRLWLSGRDLYDDGYGSADTDTKIGEYDDRHNDSTLPSDTFADRDSPRLLFVTTLRDPCDRLLSAYTFFEVTRKHNARNYKPPAFRDWMKDNAKRAAKYERDSGKRYGLTGWTTNHNYATWRFSGGLLPSNVTRGNVDDDEFGWGIPFELAIRALCQFDLILPMEIMTKGGLGKLALERLLGWTNFEARVDRRPTETDVEDDINAAKSGHVVSTGHIQNSDARSYFSEMEYRRLWEDNWLDHILYLWCRAVFLARLHCNFDDRFKE